MFDGYSIGKGENRTRHTDSGCVGSECLGMSNVEDLMTRIQVVVWQRLGRVWQLQPSSTNTTWFGLKRSQHIHWV